MKDPGASGGEGLGRLDAVGRRFYDGSTTTVARRLLGAVLVHDGPQGRTAGRIVETEAYLQGDPASHSYRGRTARNGSMFLARGHGYVYRIYGLHLCFNVVTAAPGTGEAVLVRALEPLVGLELMAKRRGLDGTRALCSGPAKLAQAMGITAEHDGADLTAGELWIARGTRLAPSRILASPRIGITRAAHERLRFLPCDSPWVSRRPTAGARPLGGPGR